MVASVKRILPDTTDSGPTRPAGPRPDTCPPVWRQVGLAAEPAETAQAGAELTPARHAVEH